MKPTGPKTPSREFSRLRARLKIREKQVQLAADALKEILSFESASQSVFASEVQELQRAAFHGLSRMEEMQHGHKLKAHTLIDPTIRKKMVILAKLRLSQLYGSFTAKDSPPQGFDYD